MSYTQANRIGMVFFILVMLLALLGAVAPVAAAPAPQDTPPPYPGEDGLAYDARIYALHMGVSQQEALHRFALQKAAGLLGGELSRKEPDTFAGLWLEHTPKFRVIVRFAGAPGHAIAAYTPNKELAALVEVGSAKVSWAELERRQAAASALVERTGIPFESSIDVRNNRVELYVVERARLDNAIQASTMQFPPNVVVKTVPSLSKLQAFIYGGLSLDSEVVNNFIDICTSGFAVKNPAGVKGITTAAHCKDNMRFGLPLTSLTFMKPEQYGLAYDIQWHTAPGFTVTNKIKLYRTGALRDITGIVRRVNQPIGGYVCKYGRITYYTCGYIISISTKATGVPNSTATFIRVDNTAGFQHLSSGGDSGGPWFLGGNAYGSHHAGVNTDDSLYMAVDYISGLGVSVMTAP